MTNKVVMDTTDFSSIDRGDKICVGGKTYEVFGHARELRFGMEDPKFWVKRAIDIETQEKKIIKLAFFESFITRLAGVEIRCFRSPEKEGKILKLVNGQAHFMQGEAFKDVEGNNVRVLDVIRGPSFLSYIGSVRMKYDVYFNTVLPGILQKLVRAFEAIRFLHVNGFRHGDVRNDHIIVEGHSGNYIWIDFDYDFEATENPFSLDIFGLGNILIYAIGKGFHNYFMIKNDQRKYGDLINNIKPDDFSLLDKRRLVNLKKLYPMIPRTLNNILMHFSRGAEVYYELVDEIIEDLNRSLQAFADIRGV